MPTHLTILLIFLVVLVVCLPGNGVLAFGAGNIPSFAYMEGRAFRHGDIEDTLADIVKKSGGFALGALIGKGGSKFGGLDVKRVYFGNWLRDYSQAVDIAGLKKLQLQTIINLCMALGFLAHGYATNEFEVTEERLGVYLPTEHIDNPKGYGDGEDARKYNPKLRGPVDPRELEIDPRSGMKNYIANESGSWDTSKALVRRTLERCIHMGRQHRAQGRKQDEYEAYRLLGQALHTLEDFSAHSNFCELALVAQGHTDVFVHVGDSARVQAQNGKWVAPLVTGTFGSSDFIHSLLGEATDHISEASVTDLNRAMSSARSRSVSGGTSPADTLRDLLFKLPGGSGGEMSRDMEGIERLRDAPAYGGKPPDQLSPQELHSVLWQVLSFRDSVVKKIEKTIEKIPGLGPLIEKLMDSISVFVFTTLEPFLKPLLQTASSQLMTASGEVINTHDQYEVFNDPRASDPTHSFLSKDHFNLILNEPAGNLAKIIVKHTVTLVTKAWDDTSMNVRNITEDILQCLFHPDFHNSQSEVQRSMLAYMQSWLQSLGSRQSDVLRRLSKAAVRNHENTRLVGGGGGSASSAAATSAGGGIAVGAAHQVQGSLQGYLGQIPGVHQAQGLLGSFSGSGSGAGQGNFGRREYYPPPPSGPSGPGGYEYGGGGGGGGGGHPPPLPPMGARPPSSPPPPPTMPGGSRPHEHGHGHGHSQHSHSPSHAHTHAHEHGHGHGHHQHGGAPPFPGGGPSFPGADFAAEGAPQSSYPGGPPGGFGSGFGGGPSFPGASAPGGYDYPGGGGGGYGGPPGPPGGGMPGSGGGGPSMPGMPPAMPGYGPSYGAPGGYGQPPPFGGGAPFGGPGGPGMPGGGPGGPGMPGAGGFPEPGPGGYGGGGYRY